jgi:hypothetical protein
MEKPVKTTDRVMDALTFLQISLDPYRQLTYPKSIATKVSEVPKTQTPQQIVENYAAIIAKSEETGLGTKADPNTKTTIEELRDSGNPCRAVF